MSGTTCFVKDQWYSQCLYSCPSGWQCGGSVTTTSAATTNAQTKTTTTTTAQPATGSTTTANSSATTTQMTPGAFPNCRFRFGAAFSPNAYDYSKLDYITIWIGTDWNIW